MGKAFSRGVLALYLVTLIWLVLFKFTFHISRVLNYHHRSLNLVPFAAPSIVDGKVDYGEMILNCIFFIPFGMLLNVNFKKAGFLPKLVFVLVFSVTAECIQYIFAIGAADITDVITNTAGGFLGLKLYDLCIQYMNAEKLDRVIVYVGSFLFLVFISMHTSHFLRRSWR
jgi:glycopeptide antibiotics resistance protein